MRGLLRNFLGTFLSRYTDLEGYWLFGQVLEDVRDESIELWRRSAEERRSRWPSALGTAILRMVQTGRRRRLDLLRDAARRRFSEQAAKTGFPLARLNAVHLRVVRSEDGTPFSVPEVGTRVGSRLSFEVVAETAAAKRVMVKESILVARHDAGRERRRHREDWGLS